MLYHLLKISTIFFQATDRALALLSQNYPRGQAFPYSCQMPKTNFKLNGIGVNGKMFRLKFRQDRVTFQVFLFRRSNSRSQPLQNSNGCKIHPFRPASFHLADILYRSLQLQIFFAHFSGWYFFP
jgi:hypothetical protein